MFLPLCRFVATATRVSKTGFYVDIMRIDGDYGGWEQSPILFWRADGVPSTQKGTFDYNLV